MSGAAGFQNAGAGGAGIGPAAAGAAGLRPTLPQALYLDLATMDFPLDAHGRYVEAHPVDHLALMLIGPTNPLWQDLPIASPDEMTRKATEIVTARWKGLLDRGDIGEVTVRANPHPKATGRAVIFIRYRNLRDLGSNPFRTVNL